LYVHVHLDIFIIENVEPLYSNGPIETRANPTCMGVTMFGKRDARKKLFGTGWWSVIFLIQDTTHWTVDGVVIDVQYGEKHGYGEAFRSST